MVYLLCLKRLKNGKERKWLGTNPQPGTWQYIHTTQLSRLVGPGQEQTQAPSRLQRVCLQRAPVLSLCVSLRVGFFPVFPQNDKLQLLPGPQLGHTKQYFLEPTEAELCSRSHCWQWQAVQREELPCTNTGK